MNNSAADGRSPLGLFPGPASEGCGKREQQDYADRRVGLTTRRPLQEFDGVLAMWRRTGKVRLWRFRVRPPAGGFIQVP
jgi:hypothetical protein